MSTWESARETYRHLEKQRPFNTGLNVNQAVQSITCELEKARFIDWFCNPGSEPRVFKPEDLVGMIEEEPYKPFEGHEIVEQKIDDRNGSKVMVIKTQPIECIEDEKNPL